MKQLIGIVFCLCSGFNPACDSPPLTGCFYISTFLSKLRVSRLSAFPVGIQVKGKS